MQRLRPYLLVAGALLILSFSDLPKAFNNDLLSLRFSFAERPASGNVAIVAIDAPSVASAGVWPWPRSFHARLIDRLHEAGVDEIAFDVDFSSTSSADQDQRLEDALKNAGGSVVLPTFKQYATTDGKKQLYVSEPLPRFAAQAWSAAVNIQPDTDGIVRRYRLGQSLSDGIMPSMGALIAGRDTINESTFLVDFGIATTTIPTFSFMDVLNHPTTAAALKGKKVIVGATAVELGDRVTVPGGRVIPGVALQALAAESLMQGRDLRQLPTWGANLGALFVALLIGALYRRWTAARLAILIASLIFCAEIVATIVQRTMPWTIDTAPIILTALVWAIVLAIEEISVRGFLRRIAERRFDRVAMSLADGLICTNECGEIVLWNPAARVMFGYQPNEVVGSPASRVLHGLHDELWSPDRLRASAAAKVVELKGVRKDGSEFLVEASLSAWDAASGQNYSIAVRDISVRKQEEEQIRYLAAYDTLTGLLNRSSLINKIEHSLTIAKTEGSEVALLLLDLDRFKEINDTLGHAGGDHVLRQAAERIKSAVGQNAHVARLGGDEFAVVLSAAAIGSAAEDAGRAIRDAFERQDIVVFGSAHNVAVSVGIAIYPHHSADTSTLMADADLAMYRAKKIDGNHIAIFEQAMRDDFEQRIALAEELQLALVHGEFELYFQPQIDMRSRKVVGAEALIRWNHPERGLVPPALFIPLLNTLPISNDVSLWTLRAACRQARQWQLDGHEIRVGVNLAPAQFRTMDLPAATALVLAETQLPARLLELEVTEDIVIEDDATARETFRRISALGVHLAWDDFGTGYGSLIYLKKFALDRLKIDQSFVRKLKAGTQDHAIVEYTIKLSKFLGLAVTAEGIETADVFDLLARLGCDEAQGYHFSPAVPVSKFNAFLERAGSEDAVVLSRTLTPLKSARG